MTEFTASIEFNTNRSSPVRWLASHVSRQKWYVVVMFLGAFGNAALAAAGPVLIGIAFNALLESRDMETIAMAALGIVGTQLLRALLQLGRNFSSEIIGQRLERDTREELYTSLLGKSMDFHDRQSVGDIMARATNDVREVNRMLNPGFNLVVGSANFLIMPLLVGPSYHPSLILAPLFFMITYVLSLVRYLRVLDPITDRARLSFGYLNSRLAESIDGIETVKGAAQEDEEIERFRLNARAYRDARVQQGRVEARFLPILLLGLTHAIGFTHAFLLFRSGALTIGDVVAYVSLLTLFNFPTNVSLMAYSQVASGIASARRILELIKAETDLDENAGGFAGDMVGRIQFDGVTFGYVDGTDVIRDVSFEVEPGETVAFVGQTGSGKSTLTKLINRTYDVDQGRVLVDGVDVRDWDLAALRRQISIIEQDIFLFSRTIAENIAFGCPEASREEIIAAAQAAQAHDFIMSFANGYETVVGDRGATLSGGQRQRLAIARAFLTAPSILILDDSTSAVDSATEDKIQQAIARVAERQTTLLITHRLSQIRWADKVVLMRKGRVFAVGDHDTLMQEHAAYRRIFEQYGDVARSSV
ncbi:MAG: ABC transporter ATP-binding protein [Chloroflexi bacterium]|nr:ABC transporter ATP-binding protein [Chloroflexota bacterium]